MALDMAAYEPPEFYEFEVSPEPFPTSPLITRPILPEPIAKFDHHQIPIEHLKNALVAAAVFSFIFFIAKDAHKAFTRRAHWIPCDFLVLSAFSIQMLNMLNMQNQAVATPSASTNSAQYSHWVDSVKAAGGGGGGVTQGARWKDFLMIHNSRTILCVFTAYVMPSMADPGLEYPWVRWVALVITVFHHVTSQFYSKGSGDSNTQPPQLLRIWPEPNGETNAHYYAYATMISLCFILLILLLASATVAGRSIERIVAQRIPLVLRGRGELFAHQAETTEDRAHPAVVHHYSCCRNVKFDVNRADQHYHLHHLHDESCSSQTAEIHVESHEETSEMGAARGDEERYRRHCHYCWRRVEDAVLKAWIIVRAYSVQPVLARSALSASAAVIVTLQILITVVGGLSNVLSKENAEEKNTFKLVALVFQSIFILMAWALINLRWGMALAYHQTNDSDTWSSGFKFEDFWTRHLKELQQEGKFRPWAAQTLDDKINRLVSPKRTTPPRPLLSLAIGLQLLLVSFSKACWLTSLIVFHNKWMVKLFKFLFAKQILCAFEDYPKYKKILEEVQMLGESPESLWVSNRKSIHDARMLTIHGHQEAECNCEELVEFLISQRKPTQQPQEKSDVDKQQTLRSRGKEESSSDDTPQSWKMKAVSLLAIMFHVSHANKDDKDVKNCVNVYSQAWEIVDFVDEAEADTDFKAVSEAWKINSEAADKYFQALQKEVSRALDHKPDKYFQALQNEVSEALDNGNMPEKGTSKLKGDDSIDWKRGAFVSAVLSEGIGKHNIEGNVRTNQKELESSLADIINECLNKTQNLLLLKSRKWALHRDEKRMGKALYTAGKAKVIMEKLASNKLTVVSYH